LATLAGWLRACGSWTASCRFIAWSRSRSGCGRGRRSFVRPFSGCSASGWRRSRPRCRPASMRSRSTSTGYRARHGWRRDPVLSSKGASNLALQQAQPRGWCFGTHWLSAWLTEVAAAPISGLFGHRTK
jgi:hypothetical protein